MRAYQTVFLLPCAAESSCTTFRTQIRHKICNNNRGNYELPYTGAFGEFLNLVADIADNGMALSTIARIHGRQLAHQALNCHAGSGKDIAGMGYLFSLVSGFR